MLKLINMKKIYLASDHAGFDYKEQIRAHLKNQGFDLIDLGTYSNERTNYAVYGKKLGKAVAEDKDSMGIAVCGSGIGISIAANRYKGARAARVVSIK
jgi:ribose 5-phosphate isomerase B